MGDPVSARTPLGTAYAAALLDLHGVTTLGDLAPILGLTPQALSRRICGDTPGHIGAMVLGLKEAGCTVTVGPGHASVRLPGAMDVPDELERLAAQLRA